ncbi:hypothetical protein COLO4_14088 [Corchorus olitorius]|uniref:Uncharacterized protein n=1 Tax=Corchorus olitorius TaxID=93759 RepID=A0A1R3JTE8_9ROSI|nr:hypothetical protein COLO4_14088 [Corchorus olitorius]
MEPHQYSKITLAKLMASCNGLVLICRGDRHYQWNKDGQLERQKILYNYYAINPKTDQYVEVANPSPSVCCYAALSFHPAESCFFKIVRFQQGLKRLNVFNSETGDWVNSSFQLEKDVTIKPIDKVVNKKDLARAIDIPGVIDKSDIPKLHVGLSNERIHLAMYHDTKRNNILKIWVLEEDYQWSLKCSFRCPEISDFYYSSLRSIGFHPYDEDVIFVCYYRGKGLELKCVRYHEQNHPIVDKSRSFKNYGSCLSNIGNGPIYHLLQCEVPYLPLESYRSNHLKSAKRSIRASIQYIYPWNRRLYLKSSLRNIPI